jgi:hypothetical protein
MAKLIKATPTLSGKDADRFLKNMLHNEKRPGLTRQEKAFVQGKIGDREWEQELKRENKKLEKWMIRNIGKRCPEFSAGCIVCKKWRLYDNLKMDI